MVTQSPTAGGAGGVVTDGVVRACHAPVAPEVPHLPAPDPVCNARGDLSNSPLHSALRFNHFTPNPSAPSAPSPAVSPPSPALGAASCAAVVFCVVCGIECGDGEASYGKCGGCADEFFNAFVAAHRPHLGERTSAANLVDGQSLPKRLRVAPPPHRKAGPPN